MASKIEFLRDVFESGRKVYAAGSRHDAAPELQKHVRRGEAREVALPPAVEGKAGKKSRNPAAEE